MRPAKAGGVSAEQALTGVYATDNAPEAIFFAILDKSQIAACTTDPHTQDYSVDYFSSEAPWVNGVVYVLPRAGFEKVGGYWVSGRPVIPEGGIVVLPQDFPYLGAVRLTRRPFWDKWLMKLYRRWKGI